jgi:hypothetical protein
VRRGEYDEQGAASLHRAPLRNRVPRRALEQLATLFDTDAAGGGGGSGGGGGGARLWMLRTLFKSLLNYKETLEIPLEF